MKKLKTIFNLIVFGAIFSFHANAQELECPSDLIHKQLLLSNPQYFNKNQILENEIKSIINTSESKIDTKSIYTIPIVVHVIHLGEAVGVGTNISNQQIDDAVVGLNNRWRNVGGTGVDLEIQFCLASIDPNGNATTGINRVNGSNITNYAANGISLFFSNCDAPSEQTIKDLSKWPVSDYYNIWVVNKICQDFGGFVGAASYPDGNPYDGTVIKYSYMTSSSSILAHELGHGYNLSHTFNGDDGNVSCPLDTNCSSNGDFVCDTPPHKQGDCGTSNPCSTTGLWSNSLNNYMSYCGSLNQFTQGQKDRIRATAIIFPRLSLLSSLSCASLGVIDYKLDKFNIFPNPSKNIITIQLPNNIVSGNLQIFNLTGERIFDTDIINSTTEINISQFSKGIYTIRFSDNEMIILNKLIVD
ncbi:MAG: zinc-dependent metalloprotease [Bacteroidota bacterium]